MSFKDKQNIKKSYSKLDSKHQKTPFLVPVSIGNKKKKILEFINTSGEINQVLIYDVEFTPSLIRIYIDNKKNSINLQSCEKFMKSLLFLFEADGITGVECEVSSPGLERQLKQNWHFKLALGKYIKIHTSQAIQSDNKEEEKPKTILMGLLHKYQEDTISIKQDVSEWTIPINFIKKANVVFVKLKTKN